MTRHKMLHDVEPKPDRFLPRIRGEYREMPGMRLTLEQAQRLWGLDRRTCEQALGSLVDEHFLTRGADGAYGRPSDVHAPRPQMARANLESHRKKRHERPDGG
jgi:hypothetical protein